jgi:hypothetical protein
VRKGRLELHKIASCPIWGMCRVAISSYAEGRTRTGTGVTAQRILSPLCLPFHHPGRDGKSIAYGLSYSYLFHQILWHFSYQLVIDWSLSRWKYTLPAERSEERSYCYCASFLGGDLGAVLLNYAPLPADRSKQEYVHLLHKNRADSALCRRCPR